MHDAPYREIPLRAQDGSLKAVALVDLEDFEVLGHYRWCLTMWGYVVRNLSRPTRGQVRLHREILGLTTEDERKVDHINGDPLDNRRENLRIVNNSQNGQNRHYGYGASRFRGVSIHQPTGKWRARCRLDGREYRFGLFDSEEDAARAAAAGRKRLMTHSLD
jgi:hypothetical protein